MGPQGGNAGDTGSAVCGEKIAAALKEPEQRRLTVGGGDRGFEELRRRGLGDERGRKGREGLLTGEDAVARGRKALGGAAFVDQIEDVCCR